MVNGDSKAEYDPSKECKIGLCGFNEMFITAQEDGVVLCNRKHCLGWEQFTSVPLENGCIALRSYHGTFMSVGRKNGPPISNKVRQVSETEKFKIISNKNGTYCFQSLANGKYLYPGYVFISACGIFCYILIISNEESLTCDGDQITEKQKFKITALNDAYWIKKFMKKAEGINPSQHIKESGFSTKEINAFLKYANVHIGEFKNVKTLKMNRFKCGASCPPYLIEANDKKYVLKVPNATHMTGYHGWSMSKINCNLKFRFELMDLLHKTTNLPIPRMIHYCANAQIFGKPFILMEYVEGKMYSLAEQSSKRKEKMKNAYYKLVVDMHSIDIYKSGIYELYKNYGYDIEKEQTNSINYLNHFDNERYIGSKHRTEIYLKLRDALFKYNQEHSEINEIESRLKQCLLHNDIHNDQMLWKMTDDEVEITALLDWEYPDIGVPLFEILHMSFCGCIGKNGQESIEKYVKNSLLAFSDEVKRDCIRLINDHWDYYHALVFYRFGIYWQNGLHQGIKILKKKQSTKEMKKASGNDFIVSKFFL